MKKQKSNNLLARIATEVEMKHVAIIASCAVLLLLVLGVRGEINLNPFKVFASHKTLSFEEAKRQIESGLGNGEIDFQKMNDQLSLVDPSKADIGKVLGMATNLDIADPLEKVLPQAYLDSIVVITTDDNSLPRFKKYTEEVIYIESKYSLSQSLIALNSEDQDRLLAIEPASKNMVSEMKALEVPSELEEYSKLKMIYYITLGQLGTALAGQGEFNINDITKGMLSLMDRLGQIRLEIYNKYGVII